MYQRKIKRPALDKGHLKAGRIFFYIPMSAQSFPPLRIEKSYLSFNFPPIQEILSQSPKECKKKTAKGFIELLEFVELLGLGRGQRAWRRGHSAQRKGVIGSLSRRVIES